MSQLLKMSTATSPPKNEPPQFKKEFFILLDSAIRAINPRALIEKNVKIESHNQKEYLTISRDLIFPDSLPTNCEATSSIDNRHSFQLDQNVYVLAFGKAALGILLLKYVVETPINKAC